MAQPRSLTIAGNRIVIGDLVIQISNVAEYSKRESEDDRSRKRRAAGWGGGLALLGVAISQAANFVTLSPALASLTGTWWFVPVLIGALFLAYWWYGRVRQYLEIRTSSGTPTTLMSTDGKLIDAAHTTIGQAMEALVSGGKTPQNVTFDFSSNKVVDNSTGKTVDHSSGKINVADMSNMTVTGTSNVRVG